MKTGGISTIDLKQIKQTTETNHQSNQPKPMLNIDVKPPMTPLSLPQKQSDSNVFAILISFLILLWETIAYWGTANMIPFYSLQLSGPVFESHNRCRKDERIKKLMVSSTEVEQHEDSWGQFVDITRCQG